jgi:hypothetical protein
MQPLSLTKFTFRIRTRNGGAVVDNLHINGRDESEAERKLRQMYRDCEILECRRVVVNNGRPVAASFEEIVDLLTG